MASQLSPDDPSHPLATAWAEDGGGAPARLFVVHVSPRVQARGGIETLHRFHRTLPGRQIFVALFDRAPEPREDYHNLAFTWRTPLRVMRARFRRVLAHYRGATVVYHNGWGLPLFHDVDGARRRMVMLHADPHYHQPDLPGFRGLVDGALAISPGQRGAWEREFPGWEHGRLDIYAVPALQADLPPTKATGQPLVLGYAGRLERGDKRVDLLPEFLRELDSAGIAYRFEILGAGTLENWLRRRLADRPVKFHGWVERDHQRILLGWDAAVYFSEHEGGPIALLEAMSAGAIPFYPARGGSWADVYVPQVDPICHYPPGDLAGAAAAIRTIFSKPSDEIARLRQVAHALVVAHTEARYRECCVRMFTHVAAAPRISQPRARRTRFTDWWPLGLATRIAPDALRAG